MFQLSWRRSGTGCRAWRAALRGLLVVALAMFGALVAGHSFAADKYEVGDEIEVYFLNKWWPATVAEMGKRGEVLADYEFAGQMQRKTFPAQAVRGVYEAGAMTPGRFWADPSGKFRIKAALLSVDDTQVTLRKPDKSEVTVAIDKLSQADQDFLKKFKKAAGGSAMRPPERPPVEDFTSADTTDAWSLWGANDAASSAIEADALPSFLKMKHGGCGFPMEDFFDKMGAVLPLGGPDSWVLAGIENGAPGDPKPSRLLWVSLAKQKIQQRQLLPPSEVVLDYHPQSRQLLTSYTAGLLEPLYLTIWTTSPNETVATPVVRWMATGSAGAKDVPHDGWARFVDAETVVQRTGRQEFTAWDIVKKAARYRLSQQSFFAPDPCLSGGRRYLALPEDKGCRILEASSGRNVTFIESPDGCAGAAFTEDGQRLAFVGRSTLYVVNLANPTAEPEKFQAEAIGTPFTTTIEWVSDDRIIANQLGGNQKVLFSLKHKLPLWNYSFDFSAVREDGGRRFRQVVDGHLVYAASVQNGAQRGLAVGAVKLPGPKVDEADAALDADSLMVVKRGTAMKVSIQCGQYNERVWAAIQKIMEMNGWLYDANANISIIAEMKQGEAKQVTYRTFGGFGGGDQTVTIAPYVSSLQLKVGDEMAWQGGSSSGAPPVVRLGQGTNVQDEVNRWQNPDPGFFERATIPEKIMDPKKRNGLGETQVTNRGLVPK